MYKQRNTITKVINKIVLLTAISIVLTGCTIDADALRNRDIPHLRDIIRQEEQDAENGSSEKAPEDFITVYDTDGFEITTSESVIDMMEEADDSELKSASQLVSDNQNLVSEEYSNYCYSKMSDNSRKIYNEIYVILTEFEEDVVLSTTDKSLIDYAFKCVLVDHPEIFYVSGYSISKYTMGDVIKKITFKGTYTMDKSDAERRRQAVDAYVDRCLAGISLDRPDYEKILYVYKYLIDNNEYDLKSVDNQNILSVCENGRTVCQGYAKMTQLLLNKMGVFCTLVNGEASGGIRQDSDGTIYDSTDLRALADEDGDGWGAHVWNIVCCDGKYYNVDTTWGDASFMFVSAQDDGYVQGPKINYDYLLVPDYMLTSTHRPKPVVDMPVCDSMDSNFYVQEGLYFSEVNSKQLSEVFSNAYAAGKTYETIKCADENVYNDMRDFLFGKEKIFGYIQTNSVKYVEFTERCALTIYL